MAEDPGRYCLDQVRRYDHDRYLCALFAPNSVRDHVFALYAFNSEIARVRESVSEPLIGQMRLQWWRDAIAEFPSGKAREHPVAQALARAMAAPRAPRGERLERLLTTREHDLTDAVPSDLNALEEYAEGTSSALLQATLDLLGVARVDTEEAARLVGIAWALVGLLRAVPFHASQRRIYLPRDLLTRHCVDPNALFEGKPGPGLAALASEIAERTETHLAMARAMRRGLPRAALPALLPATLASRQLRRLRQARFDLFAAKLQRPTTLDALSLSWVAWRGRY